ncbi:g526 [Coccomyxa viridis]|uniref:G526 protein n=1 Tax=Coccomyxa viridis TaxID=1274662 RepID=A0ABP1FMM1_9CHLO
MQLAAVEVLKGTSLMEHQELPVAQQAALHAAQEAQDAEAPRLHGHAQTLSERETALQAAQQAQSEEAALLQRLALSLSQQDSSHQITQRAQSVGAVRLQQLAKSLSERETALQATQKAQSEEAARLQRLALSLSQQERAQLYVRLEAEFFIQDALQKQAGMAQHLADKESTLKHQAAQQLQTKKQLKVRSDRASAREDTLRMCREQLSVMAAALTEKEAELALRESAVAER